MQVPIVFCADANYGKYLPFAIQSIIENSSLEHEYHIIIFDCGLKGADISIMERQLKNINNFNLKIENIVYWLQTNKNILSARKFWSAAMYGRLLIPQLCQEFNKVIYADVDMIFNRDLAELISIPINNNYLAGVEDATLREKRLTHERTKSYIKNIVGLPDSTKYINSGLLIFNIRLWLQNNLLQHCLNFLNKHKLKRPDQDAINVICQGKIVDLPPDWNKFSKDCDFFSAASKNGNMIIHYVNSVKPWHNVAINGGKIWWDIAAKTESYSLLFAETIPNKTGVELDQNSCFFYSFFGFTLLTGKYASPLKIKYYFLKMNNGHFAESIFNIVSKRQCFYLLGLRLFSKKI